MATLEQIVRMIILGIVQGLTEWLPISSTGHLAVIEHFLGLEVPLLFDIALHVATLLVVLVFMRSDISRMISCLVRLNFKSKDADMILPIVVAMIPTSFFALLLLKPVEIYLKEMPYVAISFMVNGIFLFCSRERQETRDKIDYVAAMAIGTAQGMAIVPGISRSGATIGIALMLGIRRERAFKFSLLLSIPAVLGALLVTIYTELDKLQVAGIDWIQMLLGMIVTGLAGYVGLKLLWRVLAKNSLHMFAIYCLSIGAVLALLSLRIF